MKYQLKRSVENIAGLQITLETLADLNQTIDDLFAHIKTQEDTRLLEDLCPYFGVVWPAARALAEHLVTLGSSTLQNLQILEVGCGLALPSLVAAKLGAQVTATDFHPEVRPFLERNLTLNNIHNLKYVELNWRDLDVAQKLGTRFDWIIGSDVLYEKEHPRDLAQAMALLAGKKARILLTDPGRPYLQAFVDAMKTLGYRHDLFIKTTTVENQPKDVFVLILNRASVLNF